MSSGERIPLAQAEVIAASAVALIEDCCAWVQVCGSIRRRRAEIGDVEIVAVPKDKNRLLARLDRLVLERKITKAGYGEGAGTPRWGENYRGFDFQDMRCELFLADEHNRGYIQWLRTGPGDANQFIMAQMAGGFSPVRFIEGYAWHVTYRGLAKQVDHASKRRLSVPDEDVLFRLLMMPKPVAPIDRSVKLYQALLDKKVRVPMTQAEIRALYVMEESKPQQKGLF